MFRHLFVKRTSKKSNSAEIKKVVSFIVFYHVFHHDRRNHFNLSVAIEAFIVLFRKCIVYMKNFIRIHEHLGDFDKLRPLKFEMANDCYLILKTGSAFPDAL